KRAGRAGSKPIAASGLVATPGSPGWVAAPTSATLSYGITAAQMVVYGLGMGLPSAPATESIMGAISRAKAGVGSAVNDSTRLIGTAALQPASGNRAPPWPVTDIPPAVAAAPSTQQREQARQRERDFISSMQPKLYGHHELPPPARSLPPLRQAP